MRNTLLFFLLSLLSTLVGRADTAARPNFLIILADDLGYEALGCYGGLSYETPELDAMAAQGLRFANGYTSPVCTPTRVSFHTSLYTHDHGHTGVLPVHNGTSEFVDFNAMPTFAQLFQADGYQTSTTGKWQLATLTEHPDHIANAGFDSWCVWQIWSGTAKTERYWNPYLNRDGAVMTGISDRFGPDVLAEYVKERMATAKADGEPFLIVHNEMLPHVPVVETPAGGGASLANMVNYMDVLVGDLLDEVEALGLRENTYVIFIGDNGTDTGATRDTVDGQVSGGKRDLNDIGTHVPFIVWGPSTVPVGVEDDLVDITDVFPTVCALAGVEIPSNIEYRGRSFAPQLEGRPGMPREWVHQGINSNQALFDGEWRLIDNGNLYDSRNLPAEDLVDSPSSDSEDARERLERVFDYIKGNLQSSSSGVIIDNSDSDNVTVVGEWKNSSSTSGFVGADYIHDLDTGKGSKSVTYNYNAAQAGEYLISLRWAALSNRASNVPVDVITPAGTETFTINQRIDGDQWNFLKSATLEAGDAVQVVIRNDGTDGYVIADAIQVSASGANDYIEWVSLQFDAATLADPTKESSVWGEDADPDGDGLTNRMEFAMGGNPFQPEQSRFSRDFNWGAAGPGFRAIIREGALTPEYATALSGSWLDASTLFSVVGTSPVDRHHEELTYAYNGALPAPSPLFLRLTTTTATSN